MGSLVLRMIPALLLAGALGCETPPPAPGGNRFFLGATGLHVTKPVVSLREQRFENVVPQRLDFSCGAASLATLLRYFYDDPADEEEIILSMLQSGDQERIRREGFSLLDMKRYAEARGYATRGFKVKQLDVLDRLAIPALTLINTRGYSHFVVIKGAEAGVVYLADPAIGHRALPTNDFLAEWSGVLFFVAAERDPDAWSPLEQLSPGAPGPRYVVRELDNLGLRNLTFNPLEF